MMQNMGKSIWICNDCEAKADDMKAVVRSMKTMETELGSIRKERDEERSERKQILKGIKAVEAVAKKVERIEEEQVKHGQQLSTHDDAIAGNTRKMEEGEEKIKNLGERIEKMEKTEKNSHNSGDIRQFNSMVQEVREIEKRERNVVVFNVPENSREGEEEEEKDDGGKANADKIKEIFDEISCGDICPTKTVRIGKAGRHPRQILVILRSTEEVERIIKKCREGPKLKDEVFITRDRTFKQRQEAKLFRLEREDEERNGGPTQPGGGRGAGRGRGRPRGRGGRGRGRGGGGGGRGLESSSRKRRNSDDADNPNDAEDESKRRKTRGGEVGEGGGGVVKEKTPDRAGLPKPSSEHQPTPGSRPSSELGAVGGEEESF